ncbi:DUF1433 domain-containing protein [Isobaculum melis]|uniref:DUF1433 domain-containing protein n=1 Tax=Isobaculum melis TaxID=142588 RepID=A0A1H9UME7_9LACT|nr:DUF1433 domain-containing protein [Isobaculum melis]SES10364.1 Protein of unknown function [Isobaculum melis]
MAKKKIIIATGVFILLLLGGYQIMKYKETKEYEQQKIEQKFWDEQKVRIEKFIRYNFNDIESITFTETRKTPMSVGIYGYVNGDEKKLYFIAPIYNGEDKFDTGLTTASKLGELAKNTSRFFSVTEIEELESEQE